MTNRANNSGGRFGTPWRVIGWGAAAAILLLPLAAMQFTDEVAWDGFDFVFMGALLGGVGLGLELAIRRTGEATYRIATGLALAAAFLLVWINAAVGILGGEQEDANRLYVGVVAVGLVGALIARFQPAGMVWAMSATALAQILVLAIASSLVSDPQAAVWSPRVLALNGIFAAAWLLSAWLFRKAAQRNTTG